VPQLVRAGYVAGEHAWRFADEQRRYVAVRDPARTRLFARDAGLRFRVGDLVRAHGLPREVADLAMELLPYGSRVHRWGWGQEARVRAGMQTEAKLEEGGRPAARAIPGGLEPSTPVRRRLTPRAAQQVELVVAGDLVREPQVVAVVVVPDGAAVGDL
jgi:hypothetical protein